MWHGVFRVREVSVMCGTCCCVACNACEVHLHVYGLYVVCMVNGVCSV